jgi:diketogulonate reductase-like aldo/keto reductase
MKPMTPDARTLAMKPIPSSGKPGEALPLVGLGTWRAFDVGESEKDRAPLAEVLRELAAGGADGAEGGGRAVVDSSPMYGRSESVVGDLGSRLGIRPRLFLATKVWTEGREAGIRQMEESMARLRTDTLDLIEVHNLVDVSTHLPTLRDWKERGRVRYLGITHYTASAYDEVARVLAREPLDFLQINYSAAEREAERRLLPLAAERRVAVIANRPFASGEILRRLRRTPMPGWAKELECETWPQLLLKFVVSHRAVTCAIPATSDPDHLRDNLAAGRAPMPDGRQRRHIAAVVTSSSGSRR